MSGSDPAAAAIVTRRYGAAAGAEWRRLASHFQLNEGFALILVTVPDPDGATLCRRLLAGQLRAQGRSMRDVSPDNPSALRRVAPTLLELTPAEPCAAVWLAAAIPASAGDHAAWDMAWRWGLATLNQSRNRLVALGRTLVIVGAPGLPALLREAAPDLWSIRTMVCRIEPVARPVAAGSVATSRRAGARRPVADPVPDLAVALAAIERLRGATGQECALAGAVERAARAYAARGDVAAAEACLREALALRERFGSAGEIVDARLALGDVLLDQGRAGEAEAMIRLALGTADAAGLLPRRAAAIDLLAYAVLAQGRARDAETLFRHLLGLSPPAGLPAIGRALATDMLGRAVLAQGRAQEAAGLFRSALEMLAQAGADPASIGVTTEMLGHAELANARPAEAEATFRRALALAEAGGAGTLSRAITTRLLARAVMAAGRATEAEALLLGAIGLAREAGAPPDLLRALSSGLRAVRRARRVGGVMD